MEPSKRLTFAEEEEKKSLFDQGFLEWTRNEYQKFVQSLDMYAPDDFEHISTHIKTKSVEEVKTYAKVFFERMSELTDFSWIKRNLESTAKTLEYKKRAPKLIWEKVASCENPEEELQLQTTQKSKYFTQESDVIILCLTDRYKYGSWAKVKKALRSHPRCRFDHLLTSRSE